MNLRQQRLAQAIQAYVSEDLLTYEQLHDHEFGVISVISVEISPDYVYADIFLYSQYHQKELPAFATHTESITRKRIAKDFSMRKIPHFRYRIEKAKKNSTDILTLINSLDAQYGLSRENS